MTREELRDYVDEQRTLNNIPYHVYSALIDGIDTLEQEPCEDCVSRQAAIKAITNTSGIRGDVLNALYDLPPVNPQPKTGYWVAVENEEMKTVGYYCSECDLPMETEQWTDFCPNCGCRMVEPQERSGEE